MYYYEVVLCSVCVLINVLDCVIVWMLGCCGLEFVFGKCIVGDVRIVYVGIVCL